LYFDNTAVFLGSGGFKPPEIRAYQEDEKLNAKAKELQKQLTKQSKTRTLLLKTEV